jgi:hypothetical protein
MQAWFWKVNLLQESWYTETFEKIDTPEVFCLYGHTVMLGYSRI